MRRFLILDYETRSEAPLKKCGAWEYSKHRTTEILCVASRFGTREELRNELDRKVPAKIWSPFIDPYMPAELYQCFCDLETILVAHNAGFEEAITLNTLPRVSPGIQFNSLPPDRWLCTASLAASLALPRNLEGACMALGLRHQKDMEGHKLMLKMCKPRKLTKKNPEKWWMNDADLQKLMLYCAKDVDAETEFFLRAKPLIPQERKIWVLDQKINLRGFTVDQKLVDQTLKMIALETENLNEETAEMTWGGLESTTQRDAMLRWLEDEGVILPDLRAKTISDAIKSGDVEGDALRLLHIRQAISKTSTSKYKAFKARTGADGRVRDSLVYHAAHHGRWGGAGVQPQNFPRGAFKDIPTAVKAVLTGDLEWVRFLYGNPMNVFASCLRGAIIASPGKRLFCADYASIEVRMLFWFANHVAGIKAFNEDAKMYEDMASEVYGIPAAKILKDSIERFVGKTLILGSGYQMGGDKFQKSCADQGIEISLELAKLAIEVYRRKHWPVKKLWYNLERAAIAAVKNPGKAYTINNTTWFVKGDFLWCRLPSGRHNAYYKPCLKTLKTKWGEWKTMLCHYGVNQRTRKWELAPTYGGKLTEHVVSGASRDLMAEGMVRAEDAGYEILISVHDELLAEREDGTGSIEEFKSLMVNGSAWAAGAPIKAEGWSDYRYRK